MWRLNLFGGVLGVMSGTAILLRGDVVLGALILGLGAWAVMVGMIGLWR